MGRDSTLLDRVRIASPCPASWRDMEGDDRVRFCKACKLNVYNLSAMTREQAEALVREREGRLCATFYGRRDGTVLTADCPIGISAARRRLFKSLTVLASVFLAFFGCSALAGRRGIWRSPLRYIQPFATVYERFVPTRVMGLVSFTPPKSAGKQRPLVETR